MGVTFSTEIYNIWDLNSIDIIKKVEGVCKLWSKRNLTLIGRITIIKSLALAKFIHLLLALPKPPDDFLKTIERIFYNFLWNGGPDRIKRIVIVKNLKAGGINKTNSLLTTLVQHNLIRGQNLYINNWFKKGIKQISNLLDINGNFYQFDVLKEMYGISGTFLD